jgi:hypothetical protein
MMSSSRRDAALRKPPCRVTTTTSWLAVRLPTRIVEIAAAFSSSAAWLCDSSAMPSPAWTRRFCAVRLSTGVHSI